MSLKHLNNFWRTLDVPLINCEIIHILTWYENYVLTRNTDPTNSAVAAVNNPTNVTFRITDTKLYVPVVTLSPEDDNKVLEQLKAGFKRTIK